MKSVINGKLYNTATMTILCERNDYDNGNNYCGDRSIRVTPGGNYVYVVTANGQDLYRQSSIEAITKDEIAERIDGWRLDDDEVEALNQHGILTEA
jgi:predicted chitinase